MNLYHSILRHLDDDSALSLSDTLSAPQSKVEDGISVSVPLVLRALSGVSQTEQGSLEISKALGEANTTLLYDFNTYLKNPNNLPVSQAGNSQLDQLLLNKSDKLIGRVSEGSGLSYLQSRLLVGTVSSLTMATAAAKLGGQRSDRAEISRLFEIEFADLSALVGPAVGMGTRHNGNGKQPLRATETEIAFVAKSENTNCSPVATESEQLSKKSSDNSVGEAANRASQSMPAQEYDSAREIKRSATRLANPTTLPKRELSKASLVNADAAIERGLPQTSEAKTDVIQASEQQEIVSRPVAEETSITSKIRRQIHGITGADKSNSTEDSASHGIEVIKATIGKAKFRRKEQESENSWLVFPLGILGCVVALFVGKAIFESIPSSEEPDATAPTFLAQQSGLDLPIGARFGRGVHEKITALKSKSDKARLGQDLNSDEPKPINLEQEKDSFENQKTEVQTTAKIPLPIEYESDAEIPTLAMRQEAGFENEPAGSVPEKPQVETAVGPDAGPGPVENAEIERNTDSVADRVNADDGSHTDVGSVEQNANVEPTDDADSIDTESASLADPEQAIKKLNAEAEEVPAFDEEDVEDDQAEPAKIAAGAREQDSRTEKEHPVKTNRGSNELVSKSPSQVDENSAEGVVGKEMTIVSSPETETSEIGTTGESPSADERLAKTHIVIDPIERTIEPQSKKTELTDLELPNGKYAELTADKRAGILIYKIADLANKMGTVAQAKQNRHEMQHQVWRLEQLKKQRSNWPPAIQAEFDSRMETFGRAIETRFETEASEPELLKLAGPVFKRLKRLLRSE